VLGHSFTAKKKNTVLPMLIPCALHRCCYWSKLCSCCGWVTSIVNSLTAYKGVSGLSLSMNCCVRDKWKRVATVMEG